MKSVGVILALSAVSIALGLCACDIERPHAPSWDTEITLPLISRTYGMLELVDRMAEDALSYDSLGNISFSVSHEADTVAADALLSVSGLSTAFSRALGVVEIPGPQPISEQILLADHLALSGSVPAMTIDNSKNLAPIQDIEYMTVSAGLMVITATNNFGIPLDTAIVTMVDAASDNEIGTVSFDDGLSVDETESKTIDLAGKSISGDLLYRAHLYTPGGTVLTITEKSVEIEIEFSDAISVSSATARIPAQEKSYSQNVSLSSDNRITSASIKTGSLALDLTNGTDLESEISIMIEQLAKEGLPLAVATCLQPRQKIVITRDLGEYDFVPLHGEPQPTLSVSMGVSLPGSGPEFVQVEYADSFTIEVGISELEFSSISGVPAPTVVNIGPLEEQIDIPNGFENFSLVSAVMTVEIHSAVNLPGRFSMAIDGNNGRHCDLEGDINPGSTGNPAVTTVVADDIRQFLSPIPSAITIGGRVTVGDGVTYGNVTEDDFILGKVTILSPLEMSIGRTEFETAVNKAELKSEDVDEITNRLLSGTLFVNISNHLPLGASILLTLSSDSARVYADPDLELGPIEICAGVIDEGGTVTGSIGSSNAIGLSREDLRILNNRVIYVGQTIGFPGTNGRVIRIESSDYLDVKAHMVVQTRVGDL